MLLFVLVNLTPVQNYIARRATSILADKLKTKVSIDHVRIDLLNHLVIEGLYIEDHAQDTLLYAGHAEVRITDWFFLKKGTPVLSYIGLHNSYVHLYRTPASAEWNYQFVADAFSSGPKKEQTNTSSNFEIDLKKVDLQNVRFHMDDGWGGNDMDFDLGSLLVKADEVDLKKKVIALNSIAIENTVISMDDYPGGKPPTPRKPRSNTIDTSAFNGDNWAISLKGLSLKECTFNLKSDDKTPTPNEFDPAHLGISKINLEAEGIHITGDTLKADLKHLSAKERCGLVIKEMHSKISVSPNASICDKLYLETANSKLQRYYAMHYKRFPDFQDYIEQVVMDAHLSNSVVDVRDVAYFAPQLRQYPSVVKLSGDIHGTVSKIKGQHLLLNDGSTSIKGDLAMTGLPDIYHTLIEFSNGEIMTTGAGIIKYAPSLKDDPNIAVDKILYAYFKGNFKGYIENFAANGVLTSNLGTIRSDVKLDIPKFVSDNAAYSGTISTDNFDLGTLLKQPELGTLSFHGTVKGTAFDPNKAQLTLDATISNLGFHNYKYQNITAQGTLEKKKFSGKVFIDDPNLALAFYGNLDFSQDLASIDAKANLLSSNFKALNFTKDSMLASADFDLDCKGTNIDNFTGFARLYNINLIRNRHRLDIDSIYLNSTEENGHKTLSVESNAVAANIEGNYKLSSLPYSVQYYVSGYLPNYIKPPVHAAPDQDLTFTVQTRKVDSLFAVLLPAVKGFNNASISGRLNTQQQLLSLNAKIPYGILGNFRMSNIELDGKGDFRRLGINAKAGNVLMGDSLLNISMNVDASIGNDSFRFKIATASPDAYGTATLNGIGKASGDSLYLSMLPSEFYLNQDKWEIPGGCNITYAQNYLMIKGLALNSGLQHISVNTKDESTVQSLLINTENLDISEIGALAGLASYQPDGRINSDIEVKHLFGDITANGQLKATDVKLGEDTVGNINITGNYDAKKRIIFLDQQSGIYRGSASLNVYGKIISDSTSAQKLDGGIQFNNAPLAWLSPFMTGYISNISGELNGALKIGGTGIEPDVDGTVNLREAGTKLDFLGTYYRIPNADITVSNKKIDLGEVKLYDVHNNQAILTGSISHQRFKKMRLNFQLTTPQFEVLNLQDYENPLFYGNLIAKVDQFRITGPVNDLRMDITATPVKKSHLYFPMTQTTDVGSYSYVSFKKYGENQIQYKKANKSKLTLNINANMTPEAEVTLLIDPATGDAINAKGYGNILLQIPLGGDIKMFGPYTVEEGDYTFTLAQLYFRRKFIINNGSKINFNGSVAQTGLGVDATYTTTARLYDLLSASEQQAMPANEASDAKTAQNVDVILHMNGTLQEPKLTFNVELPDRRSIGTYAYSKLERINQSDRELFDQVASLLLIGSFIPPEGLGASSSGAAVSGAINNVSQIISSSASSQLTNIVNKLLGNQDLSIDLQYKNYNLSDPSASTTDINRNELSLGVKKNLLKDRLIVEVGGAYDWGRPTSNTTTNFNLAGDFRIQYLLTENGNLRFNVFNTSNYDVLTDKNVDRRGIGLSWRRSFDNLSDFLGMNKNQPSPEPIQDTGKKNTTEGTD
jgi:hypothetical protein